MIEILDQMAHVTQEAAPPQAADGVGTTSSALSSGYTVRGVDSSYRSGGILYTGFLSNAGYIAGSNCSAGTTCYVQMAETDDYKNFYYSTLHTSPPTGEGTLYPGSIGPGHGDRAVQLQYPTVRVDAFVATKVHGKHGYGKHWATKNGRVVAHVYTGWVHT